MTLKTNDILNEIEFELMQGIVSREDLGEGIQTVQKYQNQVRSEILDAHNGTIPLRDALSRQLQINDLLLSLIQETIIKVNALQSELYRSAHLIHILKARNFRKFLPPLVRVLYIMTSRRPHRM